MRSNNENLDLFADLLVPVSEILTDKEVVEFAQTDRPRAIKAAIKNHHDAVIELLAIMEGVDPAEYIVPPPVQMMLKIIELLNRDDVKELFTLQGQKTAAAPSGSATENIGEDDQDGVV